MEEVKNNRGINIIVDFAHTPNALESVLKETKKKTKGSLICIFGCAGERDKSKRPIMGKIAGELSDVVVITADDPRSEKVEKIIEEIKGGIYRKSGIYEIADRGEAVRFAINEVARKGDVVLICGKGHEKSMAYGKIEHPWSDVEAVKTALKTSDS